MRDLQIGVIGLGVGAQHLAAYSGLPNCRVARICDLSEDRLRQIRGQYPAAEIGTSAEELIDDPAIDVVSIASFDDDHFLQVLRCLGKGKHVFVEKPLCRSIEELKDLKRAWRNNPRLNLASNLILRAAPLFETVRCEIREGRYGKIYSFDGEYLYGRLSKITEGWRKAVTDYSVMLGGGVHLVDLMLWLTGEKPSSVVTLGNRISSEATAFRYNDYAAAMFTFPSGLIGRIVANFGCIHRHQHAVRIFGTKATLVSDEAGVRLHQTADPDKRPEMLPLSPLASNKGDLIPAFIQSILAGVDTSAHVQHEFDVISVCASAESAMQHQTSRQVEYI